MSAISFIFLSLQCFGYSLLSLEDFALLTSFLRIGGLAKIPGCVVDLGELCDVIPASESKVDCQVLLASVVFT